MRSVQKVKMGTKQISVQRFSVISSKKFEDVVAKLAAGVGHPDVRAMFKNISLAKKYDEVEKIIQPGLGPTGLMERSCKWSTTAFRPAACLRWSE